MAAREARGSKAAALYDRIAPVYQRCWAPVIEPAALHLLDLVAPFVADRPEAVIVDVGAGTGPLARAAVARWPRVRAIGVDPSRGMRQLGQTEAARTLRPSERRRLRWLAGVAERLPLADRSADIVVSSFTFTYLADKVAAMREALRVLRPGGVSAIVTWLANDWPFEPWRLAASLVDELGIEPGPSSETGPLRSLRSSASVLRRAGFRRVHATEGVIEYQWTPDALVHCTLECNGRQLLDSLDPDTRARLADLWTGRLAQLTAADLRYRDRVVYLTGERPA
jgi:ubiquinone/menaquinone biosynthesis C-methylase UbiE